MKIRSLVACFLAASAFACRSDDKPNNNNNNNNNNGQVQCPGEALNVCSLKVSTDRLHPGIDEPVTLNGVLVITPTVAVSANLVGFYVVDPAVNAAFQGRYAGVAVVYNPGSLAGTGPRSGEIVNIEGTYAEFPMESATKQKQVSALRIESTGQTAVPTPIEIDSASRIGSGGADAPAYEGNLVVVREVSVSAVKPRDILGSFEVDTSLVVDNDFYTYLQPQVGEQFTSITGVLVLGTNAYDAGEYLLNPRAAGDVIPKNQAAVVSSIKDIQDPTSPGHPAEMCSNPNGNEVVGKCARAKLTRVLVTAADGYVSDALRAIFVQDASVADGRFAGVKVVYNKNQVTPPAVGQYVDVEGEVILYRDGMQIQYPTIKRNGTDTMTPVPVVVPATSVARSSSVEMQAYEGVLVKIENIAVESACVADDRDRDHGNWVVTGDVMIGTSWDYDYNGDIRPNTIECFDGEGEPTGLCGCNAPTPSRPNDQRHVGDSFASITGVLDYAFGDFQLQPRGDDDLIRN